MARRGTVGDAALAVLAQQGPLELGELARLVAERGATRTKRRCQCGERSTGSLRWWSCWTVAGRRCRRCSMVRA